MAHSQISIVLIAQQASYPQTLSDVYRGINVAVLPDLGPVFPLMTITESPERDPNDAALVRVWPIQSMARA